MVSKQLLESKPTAPTVKRAPAASGESFADDDDLTHHPPSTGQSRQSCRPLTPPVQTWRLRDRTPPATALMPRWAARETRAATTSGVVGDQRRQSRRRRRSRREPRLSAGAALRRIATSTRPRASRTRRRRGLDGARARLRRRSSSRRRLRMWAVVGGSAGRRDKPAPLLSDEEWRPALRPPSAVMSRGRGRRAVRRQVLQTLRGRREWPGQPVGLERRAGVESSRLPASLCQTLARRSGARFGRRCCWLAANIVRGSPRVSRPAQKRQ